ncbi:DUF11 domain-containing protein [Rhodopirellula sp. MGV]|uniref:DUF11 domain-containing protein n=1 Tax=Rhodopirellula sp. MGV TaxID=2023130 RepID=UPI000B968A4D|nr:DUF11 domain-containing protein [Rhodopirellula sp. MGV]OYP29858.1 hypothetical protein CGZ80_24010 [Rhodopirellula sp. MGV]PNY33740.1 hypothetical protein C2E31_26985 [Rhodopirellula baltica]
MHRGRIKNIAIYSLIGIMTGGPAWSATPGGTSRANHRRTSAPTNAVQNAYGVRSSDPSANIRQVVGKQPTAPEKDSGRTLSFLPKLLGGSPSDSGTTATRQHNHAPQQADSPKPRGILNDLFGIAGNDNRNNHQESHAATPVRSQNDPAPPVDWSGIPYHQAKSQSRSNSPAPIRDPRAGEARMSSSSQMASTGSSRLAPQVETPRLSTPSLPKAPSLETASNSTSSRRTATVPSTVASAKVERESAATLSPLSSSRRSGRRSLPTLDASEIAAANAGGIEEDDLIPKISRRRIKPEPQSAEMQSLSDKPAIATKTASAPTAVAKPEPVNSEPQPAPQHTPSADVAAKALEPIQRKELPRSVEPSIPAVDSTPDPIASDSQIASNSDPDSGVAASMTDRDQPSVEVPTISMPTTPSFGPRGNVASARTSVPTATLQVETKQSVAQSLPEYEPTPESNHNRRDAALKPTNAALQPATTAIGSGLANSAPVANEPKANSASSIGMPQSTQPQSDLTSNTPRQDSPYEHTPELPAARVAEHHVASNPSTEIEIESAPFTANPQRASEVPAPQANSVASELPGLRVVTQGPRRLIIRQTEVFEIHVENRGSIDAEGVLVRALVPGWAELKGQSTSRGQVNPPSEANDGHLVWALDRLPAGGKETLFVRLQALESGAHELDVDWTLVPQKSIAKVEVREPKLELVIEGPDDVVYGESQTYKVRVLNPGDGIAPNVVFTLSPNSPTPQTQRIGNIPSGKEAQFEVELTAQDLGDLKIHGFAAGDLELKSEAEKKIKVLAAELEAVLIGPELKYQNTDAVYQLQLTNNGTADCQSIQASLGLPPGTEYVSGLDDARKHGTKLTWQIESLPPGATREYEFTCKMVAPGNHLFDFMATGSAAGQTAVELETQVESIADLVLSINDPAAPAPVGSEVVYEIVIKNRGSRQATDVRAVAQFSKGIEPRRIEGHSGQVLTGQVLIDPIAAIRPGDEVRIRVIAEAESDGHHRFRTEIRSGETVLVSEEATHYMSRKSERVSRRSTTTR